MMKNKKKKGFQIFCINDCCNIFISDIRETIPKNIWKKVLTCIYGTVLHQTDEKKTKLNILSRV